MTRFARAFGSKASNQRIAEDSTPWSQLKLQGTQDKQESDEKGETEETNWKSVLETEKKIEENQKSIWCEFEEEKPTVSGNCNKVKNTTEGKRNKSALDNILADKLSIKQAQPSPVNSEADLRHEEENEIKVSELSQNSHNDNEEIEKGTDQFSGSEHGVQKHKNKKRNNSITWKNKNLKEQNSQGYKRRKCDEGDIKLEINDQEIWVTRLDGFYIKKEDAERIKELESELLKRGISNQEVRAAVKKERRNAEKSLARQKKKVCYHCRKGGHTLSSCPKLQDNVTPVMGSGICYKCGSTEHTHFQCKVVSGNSYKFATCFICKQEGHISKQCPDNPRGMYPTGGGCRLCGDVTHFRRECPTLQKKSSKVTAGLMDQNVEKLCDDPDIPAPKNSFSKRQNKVVKFT